MNSDTSDDLNSENRQAWDANAAFWDANMGEGNAFFKVLIWPVVERLISARPGQNVLDIATGNGVTARRLAEAGASVLAFDFSSELIQLASGKPNPGERITYRTLDATDNTSLLGLGETSFDSALCNMALFDIADVTPLFSSLPRLLRPGGCFVFSLTHPAFNNSSSVHVVEERDNEGNIEVIYSVKISRYMTSYSAHGLAMRDQPRAQVYFERPLQYYLNLGFEHGFVVDGFEERAFPPDTPQNHPLGWGGKFSEIPPVLVVRMRRK